MSYKTKYFIALALFIAGVLLVLAGSSELRSSFGNKEVIESGLWKLLPGIVLVMVGGPSFYYFRSRKSQAANPASAEIQELLRRPRRKD